MELCQYPVKVVSMANHSAQAEMAELAVFGPV